MLGKVEMAGRVERRLRPSATPGYWRRHVHKESALNTGPQSVVSDDQPEAREGQVGRPGVAESVCVPSATPVLFQFVVYGDEVIAEPMFVPSTLNCTLAAATLSDAVAERATEVPETVAPDEGTVSETEGGVVSGTAAVVNAWSLDVAVLPCPSAETTA